MPNRGSRLNPRLAWFLPLALMAALFALLANADGPLRARAIPVSQYCAYQSQTGTMTPSGAATVADAIALPDDNKFIQMDYTPGSSVTLFCSIAPSKDGTSAPDLRVDTYDLPFTAIARISVSMDNVTYYDLGDQADSLKYDATHFGKDWDLDGIAALSAVTGPFPYVRVTQNNQCSPAWDGAAGPGDCGDPGYPDLAFDLDAIVDLTPVAPPANAEIAFFKNLDGAYVHSTTATLSVVGGAINTTVAATDVSLYGSPTPGPWTKLSVPAGSYTVSENLPANQGLIAGRCVIVNGSPLDEIDIDAGTGGNQYYWGNSAVIAAGALDGGPANGPSARIFDAPDAIGPASGTISLGAGDIVYCVAYNVTLPSDVTPPAITPVVSGTLGSNGWYISDVEVSWIITDPDSLVTSTTGCETVLLTAETLGVTLTCSATSAGGTDSESVTIKIDKTPPIAVLTPTGTLGDNGWYVSDVTITTTGTETISNPIVCTPDQYQTTDTAAAIFNGSCTNDAGLTGYAPPLTIKRDATKPIAEIISVTGPSGVPDDDDDDDDDYDSRIDHLVAAGGEDEFESTAADISATGGPHGNPGNPGDYEYGTWSPGPITITFSCTDAMSGAIDGPFVVVLTGDFNGFYTGNGGCKDKAGNIADPVTTEGKILIDNTPPEVHAVAWNRVTEYLAPKYWTPYTAGTWTKYDVTIFFTCVDNGAGIAKESMVIEDRSVLNEVENYTVQTRILRCIDKAGNVAPRASFGPINIDQTKPVVTGGPTTLPNSKGWWKSDVTVNFACTDVASGFGGPAPTQSITIVTDGANQKAKSTLNCTDLAGNVGNEKTVSGINIDRVAPTCTVSFSPSSVGTLNGLLKTINALININDALSGGDPSATKLLSISNGTIGTDIVDWNIGGNDTSGKLKATAGSPYGFGYEVADKAGNTGACDGSVTR